jgi:hypothetical protein
VVSNRRCQRVGDYGEGTASLTPKVECRRKGCLIDYTDCRDLDGSEYVRRWFIEEL